MALRSILFLSAGVAAVRVREHVDFEEAASAAEGAAGGAVREVQHENASWWSQKDCTDGIVCKKVKASGLTFDCRFAGEADGRKGDVMMLHGFPEWGKMYEPLMRELAGKGYRSVACDQRGYSPGARPPKESDYNYNTLRDDIFAVADGVGFQKFHVVAHDHGAILGWYAAGSPRGEDRFLSYTAMSIPHNDAFSAGLYGEGADPEQQMASQYFSIFVMPDSAKMKMNSLFAASGLPFGFRSSSDFQKALWWYNGAFDVGVIAMPPSYTAKYLWDQGSKASSVMRKLYGGEPNEGQPQKAPSGTVKMPVLYVCGNDDVAIYCNRPYALKTKDYCPNDYQHLAVDGCGHDTLKCSDPKATEKVIDAIVHRIETAPAAVGDEASQ